MEIFDKFYHNLDFYICILFFAFVFFQELRRIKIRI